MGTVVLMASLAACATIPAPKVISDTEDRHDLLVGNMDYQIGDSDYVVRVPSGFVTDYASIPWWSEYSCQNEADTAAQRYAGC